MFILGVPVLSRLKSSSYHLTLPHLYDKYPDYVEFYKRVSKQGDFIMQDNSIFELESSKDNLLDYAYRVRANEVVVPEVLRNASASLSSMEKFFKRNKGRIDDNRYQFAAVIQGKSFEELLYHYSVLSRDERISTICIPFNFEFDAFDHVNEMMRQNGWNRFSIVWRLVELSKWNVGKQHHLLGLFNPAELAMYGKAFKQSPSVVSSIRSNDSSSVFWHSLYGIRFSAEYGLLYKKVETKVQFDADFNEVQESIFRLNSRIVGLFQSGIGGNAIWDRYIEYAATEYDIKLI